MENTKTIGGRKYSFGTIPPFEAIEVEVGIASVIGEPLFKALMTAAEDETNGAEQTDEQKKVMGAQVFGVGLGILTTKLDAELTKKLMRICFRYVGVQSDNYTMASIADSIDIVFHGRNREIWEVFFYSLRFNFQDFFPESLFTLIKDKATTALTSLSPRI
jgi:hypothetical protein